MDDKNDLIAFLHRIPQASFSIEVYRQKDGYTLKHGDKCVQLTSPEAHASIPRQILSHLNRVAGTSYRPVESNLRPIRARLREGFKPEEFADVVDFKWGQWGGSEMEMYMRPVTLFGPKMDSYLNEARMKPKDIKSVVDAIFGDKK